jgi:hypothetical protein
VIVTNPRPLDGDLAEDGLEGEGARPSQLDAGVVLAMPPLQDRFLIGFLDENLEESALEFKTRLMDARLNLVGEMLILIRHW